MDEPRYVVSSVTGYAYNNTLGLTSGYTPRTSYWVSDTWYGYREVERFYAEGKENKMRDHLRRYAAETLCAELNAEHDAALARDGTVSC